MCLCQRLTFLHHFMSGRISCRFFLHSCHFQCLAAGYQTIMCLFFCLVEPLRAATEQAKKNVWHKCLLATFYRFFAINFYVPFLMQPYKRWANDEYVSNDGEKSKQSSRCVVVDTQFRCSYIKPYRVFVCMCLLVQGWVVKMKTCKQNCWYSFLQVRFFSKSRARIRSLSPPSHFRTWAWGH